MFTYINVWSFQSQLTAGDGRGGDGFGVSVAYDGASTLVVGAYRADADAMSNTGRKRITKYVYSCMLILIQERYMCISE